MNRDAIEKEAAAMVAKETKRLMAEMRRKTSLDDEQIRELLAPFGEVAYGAGYKMGWAEAEQSAADKLVAAGYYKIVGLVSSAALVAWWLIAR
jgi:hypothetical protein